MDEDFDHQYSAKIRALGPLDLVTSCYHGILRLQSTPIAAAYLSLVILSPVWIRIIPPLGLRKIMIAYNFLCAILSAYSVFYIVIAIGSNWPQSLYDRKTHPLVKHAFLVYWMTKILELMDTVFMILRHRTRQISLLHVYHHSSMLLISEFGYKNGAWPTVSVLIGMNSLVHVFLYYYYGMTALVPGQRPLWKKALTGLQLVQFFIGLIHQVVGYLSYGFCYYCIFYEITMIVLFSNFYYKAYVRAPQQTAKSKKSE